MTRLQDLPCRQNDAELWFPVSDVITASAQLAIDLCDDCPIKDACLQTALDKGIKDGIWGGTMPSQRMRMGWRRNDTDSASLARLLASKEETASPIGVG